MSRYEEICCTTRAFSYCFVIACLICSIFLLTKDRSCLTAALANQSCAFCFVNIRSNDKYGTSGPALRCVATTDSTLLLEKAPRMLDKNGSEQMKRNACFSSSAR